MHSESFRRIRVSFAGSFNLVYDNVVVPIDSRNYPNCPTCRRRHIGHERKHIAATKS